MNELWISLPLIAAMTVPLLAAEISAWIDRNLVEHTCIVVFAGLDCEEVGNA